MVFGDRADGLSAVGGGADDVDVGEQPEQDEESFPDAGLVVGDDDPQGGLAGQSLGDPCGYHRAGFVVMADAGPPVLRVNSR